VPLALAVARRFGNVPPGQRDLRQAASLGLVLAVRGFDPERGTAFATYAVPVILGEVRAALRHAGGFGGARRLAADAAGLARARERLGQTLGREPRLDELATALGRSRDELADLLGALAPVAPLDAAAHTPAQPGDGETQTLDRVALWTAVADLPEAERRVVALRYLGEMTQREVADAVGVSQSQVSRRERSGLRRLWRALDDAGAPVALRPRAQTRRT